MTSIRSSSQNAEEARHAMAGIVLGIQMSCDEELPVRLKSNPGMRFK